VTTVMASGSYTRLKTTHTVFISAGGRGGEKHGYSRAPGVTASAHHAQNL
jgi:hypothetical protein